MCGETSIIYRGTSLWAACLLPFKTVHILAGAACIAKEISERSSFAWQFVRPLLYSEKFQSQCVPFPSCKVINMRKHFNVAGPCLPSEHYMLPAQDRCEGILDLIEQKQYFVLHSARQSGKTTLLLDLVHQLNDSGVYYALYCSLENIQEIHDVKEGIPAIVRNLKKEIKYNPAVQDFPFPQDLDDSDYNNVLQECLIQFCGQLDKPLVVLFNEVDCLSDQTLISFLRQLREGYINRSRYPFVHTLALVGMRNIRDYPAPQTSVQENLSSASPFNVLTEALTLRTFTPAEVVELLGQHTQSTQQVFSAEVAQNIFEWTEGQPWLVNAIAREIVVKILGGDSSKSIELEHVEQAVQTIILRRDTHIDSLLERLKETRVQKVMEPLIVGSSQAYDLLDDGYRYVFELGLVREKNKILVPANRVYSEVVLRTLSIGFQNRMNHDQHPPEIPAYLSNNALDMKRLLGDFQNFWRENSEIWVKQSQYQEAAPHLVLQAFLQRVINGGGRLTREMAAGSRRLDLCLHFASQRYPIELKIRYSSKTREEGKKQLFDYMDKLDCKEGWLIVFDRRKKVSWKEKLYWKTTTLNKKTIHLVGC